MKQPLVISGDVDTLKKLLAVDSNKEPDWSHVYNLNGFSFQAYEMKADCGVWNKELTIKFCEVPHKSQEEIAAEEAVRKARESLKAAEEVLNKVKNEN